MDLIRTNSRSERPVFLLAMAAIVAVALQLLVWAFLVPLPELDEGLTSFDLPVRTIATVALTAALLGIDRHWPHPLLGMLAGFALAVALFNVVLAISAGHGRIDRLLFSLMVGPLSLSVALCARGSRSAMGWATIAATSAAGPTAVAAVKAIEIRLFPLPELGVFMPAGHAMALAFITLGLLYYASRKAINYKGKNRGRLLGMRLTIPLVLVTPALVGLFDLVIYSVESDGSILIITMVAQTAVLGAIMLWIFRMLADERSRAQAFAGMADLIPIALTDETGRILHWSHGCEMLYGWSADEALGKVKSILLQSTDTQKSDRTNSTKFAVERELTERHRDGSIIHIIERKLTTEDEASKPITVLSMTDISPRVETEQALLDSEARLSLAAESHSIAIFEWDVATGALQWAGDTERQLGVPKGTVTNYESWKSLCLPEDIAEVEKRVEATMWAKAERFSFFYRIRLPSGDIRAIEGSARCFYAEDGSLERTIGVNIDVTDRVTREDQLAAREAQLRSILETVPSAMLVIDEHGVILTFSKAAERLFGYDASVAVGKNVSMLMSDQHSSQHGDYLTRYLTTGERRMMGRPRLLTALHADGHTIPVEVSIGEASYSGTRVFTGFIQDVSDRLANEERLDMLRSELTHIGRLNAMGELAAGLAHEINQPLSAIANYMATAEMMLDDDNIKRSQLRAHLGSVRQQSLRAGQIIRRMRDFASKHETESRVEPVHSVIEEATSLVLTGYERLGVDVRYDLSEDALYMLGDRVQVQQVLVNLLRNSMDALASVAPDDRQIFVGSRALDGEMLEMSVADSGPGIAPEILSELYMPFKTTKGEGGMGIGLSICRRIVEAHGGILSAENRPEGGARFKFTVPRVDKEEVAA